jgi:ElaA protein
MTLLWKRFDELTNTELYLILAMRQEVFAVEQKILYVGADGFDPVAWHLFSIENGHVLAYARVFAPGVKSDAAVFGRVLTAPDFRNQGLGKLLVVTALERIKSQFGDTPVEIAAQAHLETYYANLGFKPVGLPFYEVGVAHIKMRREAS